MYKHCSTEESARRQRQFEQCLLDLMQTVPYAQITISDICDRINLSRKSFYRYFGSKDGCLYALLDHSIMDFVSHYLPDGTSRHQELFERYFDYWKKQSPLLEALCRNKLAPCLYERTIHCAMEEDHDLYNLLRSSGRNDSYEQLLFIACGINGLLINWHMTGYEKNVSQMAATVDRLVLRMMFPSAGE